jgi:hypothetical protein
MLPIPLQGVCTILAGTFIARLSDVRDWGSFATFIVSLVAFVLVCEHLVPALIVRRDPERVLDVVLPVFAAMAKVTRSPPRVNLVTSG